MRTVTILEAIFWLSVLGMAYTYAGYPLLLALISKLRSRPIQRAQWTPTVSIIIAAYNEERDLAAKLENTLSLDYPLSKLDILVTSDCSSDGTDDIVRSFASRGVRLHRQPERLGKTAAQNAAVEQSRGEILLFSDATTQYNPDVLRVMIPCFADPTVGCVTGRVIFSESAGSTIGQGTRSYWSYEFFLKKHESSIGSLIGVCGCMYAVRRSAYVPLYHEACSDFLIATTMVRHGLRAVYEPDAVCWEQPNVEARKELAVRVRIITQTFADLWRNRAILNPFRSGFYSIQLFSHKVLRYVVPLFLLGMLAASALLTGQGRFYLVVFLGQVCFYAIATLSRAFERFGFNVRWLALPQYFLITNLAPLIAFFQLIRGERYSKWEPLRQTLAEATDIETRSIVTSGQERRRG